MTSIPVEAFTQDEYDSMRAALATVAQIAFEQGELTTTLALVRLLHRISDDFETVQLSTHDVTTLAALCQSLANTMERDIAPDDPEATQRIAELRGAQRKLDASLDPAAPVAAFPDATLHTVH